MMQLSAVSIKNAQPEMSLIFQSVAGSQRENNWGLN